jgi:hypothetical protein
VRASIYFLDFGIEPKREGKEVQGCYRCPEVCHIRMHKTQYTALPPPKTAAKHVFHFAEARDSMPMSSVVNWTRPI